MNEQQHRATATHAAQDRRDDAPYKLSSDYQSRKSVQQPLRDMPYLDIEMRIILIKKKVLVLLCCLYYLPK